MDKIRDELKKVRRDYSFGELNEAEVKDKPIEMLKDWLEQAVENDLKEPNAFNLVTVNKGKPSSRIVLCRDVQEEGIVFYTNYNSRKAKDMEANQNVAINFFWSDFDRQIRIEGKVEKLDTKFSDDYFQSRPRESQLGAWASDQSDLLEEREVLENRVEELKEKYSETEVIPRPKFWGGYLIKPNYFEFWQGRPSRLHDRIIYKDAGNKNWDIQRLFP